MLVVIHALLKACLANNFLDSAEKYGCSGQKWVSTILHFPLVFDLGLQFLQLTLIPLEYLQPDRLEMDQGP